MDLQKFTSKIFVTSGVGLVFYITYLNFMIPTTDIPEEKVYF